MKKIKIILLIVLFFSLFQTSQSLLSILYIQPLAHPYNYQTGDVVEVYVNDFSNDSNSKDILIRNANQYSVEFVTHVTNPDNDKHVQYYWQINNTNHFDNILGSDNGITIDSFNQDNLIINNSLNSDYMLRLPDTDYQLELFSFSNYNEEKLLNRLLVYSNDYESIEGFLDNLRADGFSIDINTNPKIYKFNTTMFFFSIIKATPMTLLAIVLFMISIFISLYREKKSMNIKLMNGYSKINLSLEAIKDQLIPLVIVEIIIFIPLYVLKFGFNFTFFVSFFLIYTGLAFLLGLTAVVFILLTIYSFKDLNNVSYLKPGRGKDYSLYLISAIKFILMIFIFSLLIDAFRNLDFLLDYQKNIELYSNNMDHIYRLDSKNNQYSDDFFEDIDLLKEAVKDDKNWYYFEGNYNQELEREEKELLNKVVFVNDNYLRNKTSLKVKDEIIAVDQEQSIYTNNEKNIEGLERLISRSTILCDSYDGPCPNKNIKLVDEDSSIEVIGTDPRLIHQSIINDFVIVPIFDTINPAEILFEFSSQEDLKINLNRYKHLVQSEELEMISVLETWEDEQKRASKEVLDTGLEVVNGLIMISLLLFIHLELYFNTKKKEFAISWLNGIDIKPKFKLKIANEVIIASMALLLINVLISEDIPYSYMLYSLGLIAVVYLTIYFLFIAYMHKFLPILIKE